MTPRPASVVDRAVPAIIAAGVILALTSGLPLCPTAGLLGWPCPGCGLSRATWALVQGDMVQALSYHPLVLLVLPAVALPLGVFALALIGPAVFDPNKRAFERLLVSRTVRTAGLGLCVLLVATWGLRFAGFFGGPVPVETYDAWWLTHFG